MQSFLFYFGYGIDIMYDFLHTRHEVDSNLELFYATNSFLILHKQNV